MGGFAQALTSGVGEGGEAFSRGALANYGQLLTNIDTAHKQAMDDAANAARTRQLDLQQSQQQQAGSLAQQQMELERQNMNRQGWQEMGFNRTLDDKGQPSYVYNYFNPTTGERRVSPPTNIPPKGSSYAQIDYFNEISRDPVMSKWPVEQRMKIAFPDLKGDDRNDRSAAYVHALQDWQTYPELQKQYKSPQQYFDHITTEGTAAMHWVGGASLSGMTTGQKNEYNAQLVPLQNHWKVAYDEYSRDFALAQDKYKNAQYEDNPAAAQQEAQQAANDAKAKFDTIDAQVKQDEQNLYNSIMQRNTKNGKTAGGPGPNAGPATPTGGAAGAGAGAANQPPPQPQIFNTRQYYNQWVQDHPGANAFQAVAAIKAAKDQATAKGWKIVDR